MLVFFMNEKSLSRNRYLKLPIGQRKFSYKIDCNLKYNLSQYLFIRGEF